MSRKLPLKFYRRPTVEVARDLIGKQLVHHSNGLRLSGLITETEAYLGVIDRACHTFGGRRTPRTESMYLSGGHAYVYLIYGMYWCFNVVTRLIDEPEAVLIRGIFPTEGISQTTNGPGKLCRALGISKEQNSTKLNSDLLFIEDVGVSVPKGQVTIGPRIGIDYAGEAAHWPLRFLWRNPVHED